MAISTEKKYLYSISTANVLSFLAVAAHLSLPWLWLSGGIPFLYLFSCALPLMLIGSFEFLFFFLPFIFYARTNTHKSFKSGLKIRFGGFLFFGIISLAVWILYYLADSRTPGGLIVIWALDVLAAAGFMISLAAVIALEKERVLGQQEMTPQVEQSVV